MPRLIRYVLFELIKVFVLALAVFTALMIIVGMAREAIMQNLPPAQVIWLIPYMLPFSLCVAIPVTLLLATTVVYGRMSGANEVLAIKAMGISPLRVVWPALIGAFLISLATVWLNDLAVSWGRRGAQQVIVDALEEIMYSTLRAQRRYSSSSFAINVKRLDDRKLILPTLTLQARDNAPAVTIMAKEAELRIDRGENVLTILLREATIDVEGRVTGYFSDYEQEIPLSDASRADVGSATPSAMPLSAIPSQIDRQVETIERYEQELAARSACQMICGDFDALTGPEWDVSQQKLSGYRRNLHRLLTEPHRRWAAGFSCLCFVWIGAPMAIWLRNRDIMTIFFLCFAPILVIYYPALAYGIEGAKNGTIPPYGVWMGNVILAICGAYLLRKVVRY